MRMLFCPLALYCVTTFLQTIAFSETQQVEKAEIFTNISKDVSTSSRQIIVRLQLVEVSLSKMDKLGIDFSELYGESVVTDSGSQMLKTGNSIIYSSGHFKEFLSALVNSKIARILSDSTISTCDAKAASLNVVSKIDTASLDFDVQGFVSLGTDLKLFPRLLPNDRIAIDLQLNWSDLQRSKKPARIRNYEIDTSLEMTLGKSFLMSSSLFLERPDDSEDKESVLLLVVTPELVQQAVAAKQTRPKR